MLKKAQHRGVSMLEYIVAGAVAVAVLGVAAWGIAQAGSAEGGDVETWIDGINVPSSP